MLPNTNHRFEQLSNLGQAKKSESNSLSNGKTYSQRRMMVVKMEKVLMMVAKSHQEESLKTMFNVLSSKDSKKHFLQSLTTFVLLLMRLGWAHSFRILVIHPLKDLNN